MIICQKMLACNIFPSRLILSLPFEGKGTNNMRSYKKIDCSEMLFKGYTTCESVKWGQHVNISVAVFSSSPI